MKIKIKIIFLLLFFCLALVVDAKTVAGRAIWIMDGDTFILLKEDKTFSVVRLADIDAPELRQNFGIASRDALIKIIGRKKVYVSASEKKDIYGRLLGTVYLDKKQKKDVNLRLVKIGLAWHYKKYSSKNEYSLAEDDAKKEKKGLWSESTPVAPWLYRKN